MNFNYFEFVLDNLEAAGAIAGYVSISIIGFAVISFFAKQRNGDILNQLGPKKLHPIFGAFFRCYSWLWSYNSNCITI